MITVALLDTEYAVIMHALKQALIADDFGAKHDELSVLYHTLGLAHGYGEDRQ